VKLIAIKRISAKLPAGAEFEYPDRQAKMLIAIGVAKKRTPIRKTANQTQSSEA